MPDVTNESEFNNSKLIESKLLLLYLIDKMDLPLSLGQISQFASEENYMDFFTLQETLAEMTQTGHLEKTQENNNTRYTITDSGVTTLEYFIKRVPLEIRNKINKYVTENRKSVKKDYEVTANYFYDHSNAEYTVKLGAYDDTTTLMEICISVVAKDQARHICNNWKKNINTMYLNILNELITFEENEKTEE